MVAFFSGITGQKKIVSCTTTGMWPAAILLPAQQSHLLTNVCICLMWIQARATALGKKSEVFYLVSGIAEPSVDECLHMFDVDPGSCNSFR
jgi:hypothetical protein